MNRRMRVLHKASRTATRIRVYEPEFFLTGHVVLNERTNEVMVVRGILKDSIKVGRAFGSVKAAPCQADDQLRIIGAVP